jgi:ssDNA-binding replication factor A large subunit
LFYSLCFQGNKIHATVRRTLIYKFEKDLQEGKVYSMSGFGVAANIGSYRTTKHEYKLNFQFNTKVKLCGKNGVPSDIYPISNPIDVFNSEYDTDYLVGMKFKI